MHIEAVGKSHIGSKRLQNQDAFLIDEGLRLYLVCDGMGGHAAGDVASKQATELTSQILRQYQHDIQQVIEEPGGHFKVVQMVTDAVRAVCQSINLMAEENTDYAGMGTTLTLLLAVGEKAVIAHVGDSRLYLLRTGKLHQLTNDHTLANELIQTGRIERGSPDAGRFNHVLTRCIGNHEFVDVETLLFDLLPNDRFLLCSDGQSNYFADDSEVVNLLSSEELETIPDDLIELANARGGNDNITSIVLSVIEGTPESAEQVHTSLNALEGTFLCRGLSLNRRMRIADIGQIRKLEPNQWIIQKGDERTGMYVVLSGSCVMNRPNGVTDELNFGDCFGETGLARGGRFRISVSSNDAVTVMHLPRDAFRNLVRRVPKLGRRLLDNLLDHISFLYDESLANGDAVRN